MAKLNVNSISSNATNQNLTLEAHGTGKINIPAGNELFFGGETTFIDSVKNEDTMASDDANAIPTQASVKAYATAEATKLAIALG